MEHEVHSWLTEPQQLRELAPGHWVARDVAQVSYPDAGHAGCLAVEDDSFWFAHRNRVLCELLRRHPPAGTLLDIGGGNGCVSRALHDAGFPVVLLEPGADGVRHARARGLPCVVQGSLREVGFREGSIPALGLFDVVEHVANDVSFVSECFRVLAPGGRLYVSVPALGWLWSDADVSAGHYRRYAPVALRRLLSDAGFEVEQASYFFSFLTLPVLLGRALPDGLRRLSGRPPREPTPDRDVREHRPPALARLAVDRLGALERWRLAQGEPLPLGSSLLAVARRP